MYRTNILQNLPSSTYQKLFNAWLFPLFYEDRQLIENLFKKKLLKKQNVNTYADFLGRDEADLDDMFGEEFYLQ